MQNNWIENIFTYHPPKQGQPERYTRIREEAKKLAYTLLENCPTGAPELKTAIEKISEAVMYANASIARHE